MQAPAVASPTRALLLTFSLVISFGALAGAASRPGDAKRGAEAFQQCAACHSIDPGRQLTGPSLSGVWGRTAGTVEGFARYSEALKKAGIVWNESTIDRWLRNPAAFIPGTLMTFPGVKDEQERADLIAYLRALATEGRTTPGLQRGMMAQQPADLKTLEVSRHVRAIRYCQDAYYITTAAGETLPLWEFNVRFKTDSSKEGPRKGAPVLVPSGMRGDRVFIVFSTPEEISAMIERRC